MTARADKGEFDVEVSRARCQGFGFCADVSPEVYALDSTGYNARAGQGPWQVQATLTGNALDGIAECPVHAIRRVRRPTSRQ